MAKRTVIVFTLLIAFVCSSWNYADNSLIAWFRFNKATGLTAFNSSNYSKNSNGTLTNGAFYSTMQRGGCVYLDGTNDFVNIPDNDIYTFGNGTIDRPFSISIWVYNQNTSGNTFRIVSKTAGAGATGNEWMLTTNASGGYLFVIYSNGNTANNHNITSTVNASGDVNRWVHITATYNGNASTSGMAVYRNGIKLSVTNATSGAYVAMSNQTTDVSVGLIFRTVSPTYGKGFYNDLKFYNRALNETEVMQKYLETVNEINNP